jgi:hypothetical protein
VDFFKTLYFLRWSANISLIDFEQLPKGTATPDEEWDGRRAGCQLDG